MHRGRDQVITLSDNLGEGGFGARPYGSMEVCMYAYTDVWMYGCTDMWRYGCGVANRDSESNTKSIKVIKLHEANTSVSTGKPKRSSAKCSLRRLLCPEVESHRETRERDVYIYIYIYIFIYTYIYVYVCVYIQRARTGAWPRKAAVGFHRNRPTRG